ADDLLAPDKIECQMQQVMKRNSPRMLLSSAWARFIYRPHKAAFTPTPLWRDLDPTEGCLCKMEEDVFMQTATWLVSRQLTEAAGAWDRRLVGDDGGEYFCRVILASDGVRFVPGSKVFYRRTAPSARLSHIGLSKAKADAHFLSMRLHIQHIRSVDDS